MIFDNNQEAFFALVRAGLWEQDAWLSPFGSTKFSAIYKLAEEQSVVGLVAAGLERVSDVKPPKDVTLQFVGQALQLEQRNMSMNAFVSELIETLRHKDIYTLLVKGQGVAQCYERPLWRACGDVDLFLSSENYEKAKRFLIPFATNVDEEDNVRQHLALTIQSWVVELHGELPCGVSRCADKGLEAIKKTIFEDGEVRTWMNGSTQVFLPSPDNDVILVFTHILQHFFYGGIGLRQVCDWSRLLWTYREKIDIRLLKKRIRSMGLMTEWKAFATLAVNALGIPEEAMPLYDSSSWWKNKADKILSMILDTGNFGHNRDTSYYQKYPFLVYKAISFWKNTMDSFRHFTIFPKDATRVWFLRLEDGIREVLKKK